MSKRDRRGTPAPEEPARPFHNPFGGLAERFGISPAPQPPPARPAASNPAEPAAAPARAVVRLERKGRGGKEVTVVEKLELSPDALAALLRELKHSLGCGGAVEGGALALQGDLRERVKALLESRGVRKVTVS
jgi:translation initiation factor 1